MFWRVFKPLCNPGISSIDLTMVGPYYTYHTEYDNYDYLSKYADPGMKANK